jgi:hypothetical protein
MIIIMLVHIVTVLLLLLPTTPTIIIIITGGRGSSIVSAIMLAAQSIELFGRALPSYEGRHSGVVGLIRVSKDNKTVTVFG